MMSSKRRNLPGSSSPLKKKSRVSSPIARNNKMISRPKGGTTNKRLVIKNLVDLPSLPSDFLQVSWKKLSSAITAIHSTSPIPESKESLYRLVKDLCAHKLASPTFHKLEAQIKSNLKSISTQLQNLVVLSDPLSFLQSVEEIWLAYCIQTRLIRDIFLYLDRTYVANESQALSIWEVGLVLFREVALGGDNIVEKIVQGFIREIEKERKSEVISRSLLQNLSRMLCSLDLYKKHLEPEFLHQSERFYQNMGDSRISTIQTSEYLELVEKVIEEEADRARSYLDPSTSSSLLALVDHQLVKSHCNTLLEKGFRTLMKEEAKEHLKILYKVLKRTSLMEPLKENFNLFVKEEGIEIVQHPERDPQMVEDLLEFKRMLHRVLVYSFAQNEEFGHSMKEGFETFINQRQNKPAELMACYVDKILRRGKKNSEEETENNLQEIVDLFRSVQGKDIFQGHYRKHLSTRLLMEKSKSLELEKLMVSKLKQECGSAFTSKLEGMFKDLTISEDLATEFKSTHPKEGSEFIVNVLSVGIWPEWPIFRVKLPSTLSKKQELFEKFYGTRYNGRKLTWQNCKSHCILHCLFEKGNKTISTSLFQALVLLSFNHSSRLSVANLKETTGITDEKSLQMAIQSLCTKNARILLKQKGAYSKDMILAVNKSFSHVMARFRVTQVQEKESEKEKEETNISVFLERQYQIDAAIVRVMKTRKKLKHAVLLSELYQQLQFPVKPADIKKRIESLIEREYLERESSDSQTYSYLA